MQMQAAYKTLAPRVNVLGGELQLCSQEPVTGFLRNGYCDTSALDYGSHTVAAIVTEEFLDYSAQQGNDLRTGGTLLGGAGSGSAFPGLKGGCKWCLCAARWKEAFDVKGRLGDSVVPKVILEATHQAALNIVSLEELRAFAVPKAATGKSEL